MSVKVFRVDPKAKLPERKSSRAAGFDICCLEDISIMPGERIIARTGLIIQPPPGYHTEVLARSGSAAKYGIMLTNNVGLVDEDFSGPNDELKVLLYRTPRNLSNYTVEDIEPVHFSAGDRIGQLVFRKTEIFEIEEVDQPPGELTRGGLGSTGLE